MPMQIPKPSPSTVKAFEELTPDRPNINAKKIFGQPAAFVNGNMFFGVFGEGLIVRLSEDDLVEAKRTAGFRTFEPMPGRAMKEYVVLPPAVVRARAEASKWVSRSLTYVSTMPPKKAKKKVK
jgi:TfoX/Sxy family transcriptional regulator of competence genes